MADEPEDLEETASQPPAPQPVARHIRAYSQCLDDFREGSPLSGDQAETVFILVLCSLRQQLVQEPADDLRVPLPVRLHEAFQACQARHTQAAHTANLEELRGRMASEFGGDHAMAESTLRRALSTLRAQLSESEGEQVGEALPLELRALWARPI